MSEKKDLKQEELSKVSGGVNQDTAPFPIDTNFKPEDVKASLEGGEEEGPEILTDGLK